MNNSALANYLNAVQDAGYELSNEEEVTALVVERKDDFVLVFEDEDPSEYTVARFLKGVYNDYTGVGEFEGTLAQCLKFVSKMPIS